MPADAPPRPPAVHALLIPVAAAVRGGVRAVGAELPGGRRVPPGHARPSLRSPIGAGPRYAHAAGPERAALGDRLPPPAAPRGAGLAVAGRVPRRPTLARGRGLGAGRPRQL